MVQIVAGIGLMYILLRTPNWILSAARLSSGRSMIAGAASAYMKYKTLGVLGRAGGAASAAGSGSKTSGALGS